jgi:hypothetical protein
MDITAKDVRDALFRYLVSHGCKSDVLTSYDDRDPLTITVVKDMISGIENGEIFIQGESHDHNGIKTDAYMKYTNSNGVMCKLHNSEALLKLGKFIEDFIALLSNPINPTRPESTTVTLDDMKNALRSYVITKGCTKPLNFMKRFDYAFAEIDESILEDLIPGTIYVHGPESEEGGKIFPYIKYRKNGGKYENKQEYKGKTNTELSDFIKNYMDALLIIRNPIYEINNQVAVLNEQFDRIIRQIKSIKQNTKTILDNIQHLKKS